MKKSLFTQLNELILMLCLSVTAAILILTAPFAALWFAKIVLIGLFK